MNKPPKTWIHLMCGSVLMRFSYCQSGLNAITCQQIVSTSTRGEVNSHLIWYGQCNYQAVHRFNRMNITFYTGVFTLANPVLIKTRTQVYFLHVQYLLLLQRYSMHYVTGVCLIIPTMKVSSVSCVHGMHKPILDMWDQNKDGICLKIIWQVVIISYKVNHMKYLTRTCLDILLLAVQILGHMWAHIAGTHTNVRTITI